MPAVWLLACALATSSAAAQQAPGASALAVDAAESCATRAAIVARVRKRAPQLAFDVAGGPALHVAIERAPSAVGATLTVQSAGGERSERRLSATSCADIVDAVALLIALTLDPFGASAAERPPRSASDEHAPEPLAAPVEPAPAVEAVAVPSPEPVPEKSTAPAVSAPSVEPATSRAAWRLEELALGVSGGALAGPSPEVMPTAQLWAFASLRGWGVLVPALRVQGQHAFETEVTYDAGVASFVLDALAVDLCALRFHGGIVALRACAAGSFGSFRARGSATFEPRSYGRRWLSAGPALRATLEVGILQLEARFTAEAVLERYRFAFQPQVFHRAAPWAAQANLGVGVRFP